MPGFIEKTTIKEDNYKTRIWLQLMEKLIWAAGVTGRKGYQSDCPVPVQSEKGS